MFGLVVPSSGGELPSCVDRLARVLGEHAGVQVERRDASSYESLAKDVREGRVDLAWLPPIVYVRLADVVTPIGSIRRGGQTSYEAALVVKSDSRVTTIDGLRNTRAGWVDPWSAAGFVMPRVKLALLGVDPRTVFRTEVFHGSHRAAMKALADGACDVAGTYARSDASGNVLAGAWTDDGIEVRVLATFGAIPPDVIAVQQGFSEDDRLKVLEALRAACADESSRAIVREVFSGDQLEEGLAPGYDALKSALALATGRGLFD